MILLRLVLAFHLLALCVVTAKPKIDFGENTLTHTNTNANGNTFVSPVLAEDANQWHHAHQQQADADEQPPREIPTLECAIRSIASQNPSLLERLRIPVPTVPPGTLPRSQQFDDTAILAAFHRRRTEDDVVDSSIRGLPIVYASTRQHVIGATAAVAHSLQTSSSIATKLLNVTVYNSSDFLVLPLNRPAGGRGSRPRSNSTDFYYSDAQSIYCAPTGIPSPLQYQYCNFRSAIRYCLSKGPASCTIQFATSIQRVQIRRPIQFGLPYSVVSPTASPLRFNIAVVGNGPGFQFYGNGTQFMVTLSNPNVTHNSTGGLYTPLYADASLVSLTLKNIDLYNFGHPTLDGGAIYFEDLASLTLDGVVFKASRGAIGGGAYLRSIRSIAVFNSTFLSSSALGCAGLAVFSSGHVNVSHSKFQGGRSLSQGGGFCVDGAQTVIIADSQFSSNVVSRAAIPSIYGFGGAVAINNVTGSGSAGKLVSTAVSVVRSLFQSNTAQYGSAIALARCTNRVFIRFNRFQSNTADIGTVYWLVSTMKVAPEYLTSATDNKFVIAGSSRNVVRYYGPKWATEASLELSVDPAVMYINEYFPGYAPLGATIKILDYYGQLVTSENTTLVSVSIANRRRDVACDFNYENAAIIGRTFVPTTAGMSVFSGLGAQCIPNGHINITFTSNLRGDPYAFPLYNAYAISPDTGDPVLKYASRSAKNIATVRFRPCHVGEKFDITSSTKSTCSVCQKSFSFKPSHGRNVTQCTPCPKLADRCIGDQIFVVKGFWRWNQTAVNIFKCPLLGACLAGNVTNQAACAPGYYGPTCGICQPGYYLATSYKQCLSCNIESQTFTPDAKALVGGVCFCIALYIGMRYIRQQYYHSSGIDITAAVTTEDAEADKRAQREMEAHVLATHRIHQTGYNRDIFKKAIEASWISRAKITLVTYQILIQCPVTFQMDFPPLFTTFLNLISIFKFDFFSLVPSSCYFPYNYITTMVLSTLLPAVVLGALIAAYLAAYVFQVAWIRDAFVRREVGSKYRIRCTFLFLMFSYFILPSLTQIIYRVFDCIDVDPYGEGPGIGSYYMRADLSVSCSSDYYYWGFGWAVIAALSFTVGVPLLFFALLYANRHEIMHRGELASVPHAKMIRSRQGRRMLKFARLIESIGFMFIAYEPDYWYWEIVEISRRLLLTSILSLVFGGSLSQLTISIFISLVYLKLYNQCKPYVLESEDLLSELGQYQVFFTFFVGAVVRQQSLGTYVPFYVMMDVLLVLINLFSVLMLIYYTLVDIIEWVRIQTGTDVKKIAYKLVMVAANGNLGELKAMNPWKGAGKKVAPAAATTGSVSTLVAEIHKITATDKFPSLSATDAVTEPKEEIKELEIVHDDWRPNLDMSNPEDVEFVEEVIRNLTDENLFKMQAMVFENVVKTKRVLPNHEKFLFYSHFPVLLADSEDLSAGSTVDLEESTLAFLMHLQLQELEASESKNTSNPLGESY